MEIKSINHYDIDNLLSTAKQISSEELNAFLEFEKLWGRRTSKLGKDTYFSSSIEFFVILTKCQTPCEKIIHETKKNQGAEFAESVTTMYELMKELGVVRE